MNGDLFWYREWILWEVEETGCVPHQIRHKVHGELWWSNQCPILWHPYSIRVAPVIYSQLPDVNLTPKSQDLKAPTLVSPNTYFHTKWGNVSKALKHHPNSSFEDPTSFTTLAECWSVVLLECTLSTINFRQVFCFLSIFQIVS